MKKSMAITLLGLLTLQLEIPLAYAQDFEIHDATPTLIAQRRGGGGGGGARPERSANRGERGGGSITRPERNANRGGTEGFNRNANRDASERPARNVNRGGAEEFNRAHLGASGSGRINRERPNSSDRTANRTRDIDRNELNNRANNFDRNRNNNRDFNLNSDRQYSNRINRNIVNTGNRNIIVNPRGGYGNWGWNGGVAWSPNYSYWGGGFWGGIAVGAVTAGVTSAIINSASQSYNPNYIDIEQNSPGYNLLSSYGLIQVSCIEDGSQVYIYGPQDSLICANPNSLIQPGYYEVDPSDLTLALR